MLKNYKKFNIIHPFLISLLPVLFIYSQNAREMPIQEIILPALSIFFAAVLLWLLVRFIIKNNEKSGLIISLLLVLSFSYGHIFFLVDDFTLENSDIGRHRYLVIPFAISFIVGTYYFVKTKIKLNKVTTIVNVFAGTFLAVILINVGTYNIENVDSFDSELITSNTSLSAADTTIEMIPPYQGEIKNYPDVYYIVLDAYTGSSSLKKFLNYDNQEFVSYLTNKGFNVNHKSHSNYFGTELSTISTFNMRYHIADEKDGYQEFYLPYRMYEENIVMQNFKSAGYKIILIHKPLTSQSLQVSSSLFDLELCKRNKYVDTELFSMTIKTSILVLLLEKWEEHEMRETTLCGFSELPKQHQKFDEPIFVYAHMLIPHPPYLFSPEGEPISSVGPDGLVSWKDKEGYIDAVKFANKKIKEVVDELLTDLENPPIIIIQADHGSMFDVDPNIVHRGKPSNENIEQMMSIFSAYYLPGIEKNLSYDVITSVNTFRIIFNSYLNTDYDLLEKKMYLVDENGMPEYFIDVTDVLIPPGNKP